MKTKINRLLLTAFCSLLALAAQAQFIDVDVTHPYFHAISDLYDQDIVRGYDINGQVFYRPRQSINRAEVLKILMESAGLEIDENSAIAYFPDVAEAAWFATYVQTAASRGIVKGYADGSFYPDAKVTRAEFLKMLIETFELPYEESLNGEWFEPYVTAAKDWRLLPAEEDPHAHINRGEVAEVIFRATNVVLGGYEEKYTFRASGKASYYNEGFAGRATANGEVYDPFAFTAAHRTLPFNTRIRVFNEAGDSVVVRINDRGPYHEDRVLDLSEGAFSSLAPISRGVIPIDFVVISDPQDTAIAIPEQLRESLEIETRNPEVPEILKSELRDTSILSEEELAPRSTRPTVQALFEGNTSGLPADFYPNVELRSFIPQKIVAGQVIKFSGRVTSSERPKIATVFLSEVGTSEQQFFTDELSGKNFEMGVAFYQPGNYNMGLVFDDDLTSRIASIEVVAESNFRTFPASDVRFASNIELDVVPEDSIIKMRWSTDLTRLSRFVFSQGNRQKTLIFEQGLNFFDLPFEFIAADFDTSQPLVIALEQADSSDGTLLKQTTNWKSVTSIDYKLVAGFPDKEKTGVLSVSNFSRYFKDLSPVVFQGQVLDSSIRIANDAFITTPSGDVLTVEPSFTSTRSFTLPFEPAEFGRYVLEIIADDGTILFNRGIYVDAAEVLPVLAKSYTPIVLGNKSGIIHWINTIRSESRKRVLLNDAGLSEVAQAYAVRMANEGFIAHVSPDGSTLLDRVEGLDFRSYGENLAFGSTLELALHGLEDSASHYKNIQNSTWQNVGIGLHKNDAGEFYIVQIFAK